MGGPTEDFHDVENSVPVLQTLLGALAPPAIRILRWAG